MMMVMMTTMLLLPLLLLMMMILLLTLLPPTTFASFWTQYHILFQRACGRKSNIMHGCGHLGHYSSNGWTSYRKISRSREAARLDVIMIVSLWNLTGISAAMLSMYLSNFRAIVKIWTRIARLRDFTRSCGKTSIRLMYRGPAGSTNALQMRTVLLLCQNKTLLLLCETGIGTWVSNHIHFVVWSVITHTCPNFNGDWTKPPLKLSSNRYIWTRY